MPDNLMMTMPLPEYQRERAVWYLGEWLHVPYDWGNDDFSGLDCSGLIVEILQAVGRLYRGTDYTANSLFGRYADNEVEQPREGCLAFWHSQATGYVTHVEMFIDRYYTIGASGGGRPTFDLAKEVKACPMLNAHYAHLGDGDINTGRGDVLLRMLRRELSREQAIQQNGFVKLNWVGYRGANFKVRDPFIDTE